MKKWISLLLTIVMVISIIPIASIQAEATGLSLSQLKAKFPAGKYWNHVGLSSNNQDGYTNTPCSSHSSTSTCNAFTYNGTTLGWQCFGFALKLGYDAYGSNPKSWGRAYNLDSIKPGDIINYNGSNPGHTVFVTGVSGDVVSFAECNYGGRCLIRWDRSLKKSQFNDLYNVYVAPYALSDDDNTCSCSTSYSGEYTTKDVISSLSIRSGHGTNYSVIGSIPANAKFTVSKADGIWAHVTYDGITGYASMDYLEKICYHSYDTFVFYEAVHPHYNCYQCSCGDIQRRTSETNFLYSSCDYCYESVQPEKPVITSLKTVYYCNEDPIFSWTETANTTHNNLWLYKFNDESLEWETYEHTFYVENNTKRSLPEGYYSLMIQSCNSEYFYLDGSTWLYAESDEVYFSVIDTDISSMNDLKPSASAVLGDSIYERYDYATDWETAQKWCEAQGGYLATISNEEENSCISSITAGNYWIGAVSKEKNGSFEWVTGEPFTYTNWGEGEPSDSNNNEDYVHIQTGSSNNEDGSWNDSYVNSYLVKGFILERPNITLSKITVNTNPTKTVYCIGENFDSSGLELRADYSNGTYNIISEGFETSGFSSETAGTKTVTVSYGGKTTSFTVTVNEPEPEIDENAPQIVLESKKVTKGKEFTVAVTIKNNPGFTYLELTPTYSSELTLVGVENGELISDLTKGKQYIWVADNDVTDDGILMTFTFTTADSIEPGKYEVGFIVRGCVNYDEQNVDISVVNGEIEIVDIIFGDLDADGYITVKDSKLLKKYLLCTVTDDDINMMNADIDSDGSITTKDSKALKKILLSD